MHVGKPKKVKKLFLLAHKNLRKKLHKVFLAGGVIISCLLISLSLVPYYFGSSEGREALGANFSKIQSATAQALSTPVVSITSIPTPTFTPTATSTPIPTATPTNTPPKQEFTPTPHTINPSQYTAQQLNDTTWRVDNVPTDDTMASAQDIINALNSYRGSHGRGSLTVDGFLQSYAQGRADKFAISGLDGHADFQGFMNNDGFSQAGFNSLGENSAVVSGPMNGEKIIRQIFGADPSHDSNQLDSWTHVGVGVNGNAINVNFGRGKR